LILRLRHPDADAVQEPDSSRKKGEGPSASSASSSSSASLATSTVLSETGAAVGAEDGPNKPRVKWAEDTVDNSLMGKKSSKRCCIFHKVKKFGESDSDESDEEVMRAKGAAGASDPKRTFQRHHA
jgi:protein phosphatase 1 regulatory subunit 11